MINRVVPCLVLSLALTSCGPILPILGGGRNHFRNDARLPRGVQAISLVGDTLRTLPLSMETRRRYEQQLAEARAAYERVPTDADSIIWLGRREGYLGHFREAIEIYTRGIALHPYDARLYRHRGHRYISVREFNNAIVDLERAARLAEGRADQVEPDGQPNPQNRPIGTLRSNIYYHLGLAHYLKGDFLRAIPIYRREMLAATNDDRRVSVAHWYYMALRRIGRAIEATQFLRPFRRDMDVIENDAYHRLLLMYKGALPVDSLLPSGAAEGASVADVTTAYGVANWHLYNGRRDEAERVFRRILASRQWGAFGYIAAEAELARMGYAKPATAKVRSTVAPVLRAP
jgi:tetratricopeptide (TPR) repeat protein